MKSFSQMPRVIKWPFWVGDILLVAMGIFLAVMKWGELSAVEMLVCIASVFLGVSLFTLPYLIEFRAADRRSRLNDDLITEQADQTLEQAIRVLKSYNEQSQHIALNLEAAENVVQRIESHTEAFQRTQNSAENVMGQLALLADRDLETGGSSEETQKELARVSSRLERMEDRLQALDNVSGFVKGLQEQLEGVADEPPEPIVRAFAEQKAAIGELKAELAQLTEPLGRISETIADSKKDETSSPEEVARTAQLLEKALAVGDISATSPAVARLIEGNSKTRQPTPGAKSELPAEGERAPAEPAEAKAADTEQAETAGPKQSKGPTPLGHESNSEATEAKTPKGDAPAAQPQFPEAENDAEFAKSASEPTEQPKNPDEQDPPSLGLDVPEDKAAKRRQRVPAGHASLTAEALIGIGNKLFLRGEGPGLSKEKGVPLEFLEIGKWRWTSPEKIDHPLNLSIYLNDETPAQSGPITLEPGESAVVKPKFS
jgi:hypothetical protein